MGNSSLSYVSEIFSNTLCSSLDLHHVINHPLSRLILGQFQDKDGCSRNGCCELLFDLGVVSCKEDYRAYLSSFINMNRGVPRRISKRIVLVGEEGDLGERILNFSTCEFSNLIFISDPTSSKHLYSPFISSHLPPFLSPRRIHSICEEELKVLRSPSFCSRTGSYPYFINQLFEITNEEESKEGWPRPNNDSQTQTNKIVFMKLKLPSMEKWNGFSVCDGHVIGF